MTRQIVNTNEFGHDCAIIITVHNHVERFGIPCLNSILKYSGGARVFLYDNESADPKIVVLKQLAIKHSEIDYIRIDDQSTFGGLTGTWNDGIRRAREAGLKKVILLNHDVVVDETWENFIKAIDSDTALYGPLSNLPGGGDGNRNPQKSRTASFEGLLDVDRLIGFCLGFTLGKPELKLFDDWRFFNPERPFGGNEFGIQKQMKSRSATTRFYVVTDTWVFHHLNMGWKDKPRFLDPYKLNLTSKSTNERSTETRHKLVNNEAIFHTNKTSRIVFNHQSVGWKENPEFTDPAKEKHTNGMTVTLHNDFKSQSSSYVVSSNENNISHIFRREVLPLIKADLGELSKAMLYIIEDGINKKSLNQRWRLFILSKIFYKVAYISATDAEQKTQLSWLKTEYSFNHHDFIDYSPNNDFIQLSDLIKEQAGINSNDLNYVLLSQRPVGNRYLIDSETGIPLEEYLRNALGKRSIPFKFCDFSVMAPAEQAKVCGGAKLFISAHGAGNSNIIFTPSHCHILEYNFRKYWHCHPVCDAHFHGELPDHQKCDGEFKEYPLFHKADYHNLCHLLGRPYTELEAIRYEGFNNRNPIGRRNLFVNGVSLLDKIEKGFLF